MFTLNRILFLIILFVVTLVLSVSALSVKIYHESEIHQQLIKDENVSDIFYDALKESLPLLYSQAEPDLARIKSLYSKYSVQYHIQNLLLATSITKKPEFLARPNKLNSDILDDFLYERKDITGISSPIGNGYWLNIERGYYYRDRLGKYILYFFIILINIVLLIVLVFMYMHMKSISRINDNFEKIGFSSLKSKNIKPDVLIESTNLLYSSYNYILELMKTRRQIIAHVTHDIRLPLQKIMFALEKLPKNETVTYIKKLTKDVTEMIEDILTISQATTFIEKSSEINLSQFISSLCQEYKSSGFDINFISRLKSDLFLFVPELKFKRLLDNLLNNALKYDRSPTLELLFDKSTVKIILENKMIFIKNHFKVKSFNMGILITNEIVSQLGGIIEKVKSDEKYTVIISLPLDLNINSSDVLRIKQKNI